WIDIKNMVNVFLRGNTIDTDFAHPIRDNGGNTVSLQTGNLKLDGTIITADFAATLDATSKKYVDDALAAFQPLETVYAASTANIVGTYANGVAGIGATFTVTATGALSMDSVSPPLN